MKSSINHIGSGWGPRVDEEENILIYTIPVQSGFYSTTREFKIERSDLEVLKKSRYRYAVLYISLAEVLQRKNNFHLEQEEFNTFLNKTLHSKDEELALFIEDFNRKYHMSLEHYIEEYLKRKTD